MTFSLRLLTILLFLFPAFSTSHANVNECTAALGNLSFSATKTEQAVWKGICKGETVDVDKIAKEFNANLRSKNIPVSINAKDFSSEHRISSRFLETILNETFYKKHITKNGVRIKYAWFTQPIDLINSKLEQELTLEFSRFEENVDMRFVNALSDISLEESTFVKGLSLNRARITGALMLRNNAQICLPVSGDQNCKLDLIAATIGHDLELSNSRFYGDVFLDSISVGKRAMLNQCAEFNGKVILRDGNYAGQVNLGGSIFRDQVNLNSARFSSHVFLGNSSNNNSNCKEAGFWSDVILISASIKGNLEAEAVEFHGKLDLDGIRIQDRLHLRNGSVVTGQLIARGAQIGQVDMQTADFHSEVDFTGATISGWINFNKKDKSNSKQYSAEKLIFDQIKLAGSLDLNETHILNNIELISADIRGSILLRKAKVGTDENSEFSVLRAAKVAGNVELKETVFLGGSNDPFSLEAQAINVNGDFKLDGARFEYGVDISFATIGSNLILDAIQATKINLTNTAITNLLSFSANSKANQLWLRETTVDTLEASGLSWEEMNWKENERIENEANGETAEETARQDCEKDKLVSLELDGFTYNGLGGFYKKTQGLSADAEVFKKWLELDCSYSTRPYEHLATILIKSGQQEKANQIKYFSLNRESKQAEGSRKAWLLASKWFFDFGVSSSRHLRIGLWILAIIMIGSIVLNISGEARRHKLGWGIAYSIDLFLPVIKLRELHYKIDINPPARYYFYFHIIAGYIIATMFITGLIGI